MAAALIQMKADILAPVRCDVHGGVVQCGRGETGSFVTLPASSLFSVSGLNTPDSLAVGSSSLYEHFNKETVRLLEGDSGAAESDHIFSPNLDGLTTSAKTLGTSNVIMVLQNTSRAYDDYGPDGEPAPVFGCKRTDLMQQFFLAKTELLLKQGWDDKLKNNDHYDFLLGQYKEKSKMYTCFGIKILHSKEDCTTGLLRLGYDSFKPAPTWAGRARA